MKIIVRILIALAGIVILTLLVALFVKKEYAVEREVSINKPVAEVFDYVLLLKNQDNYSVWANMDTSMIKEFRGTDGQVGFVSAWDSQNKDVGKGEQEITGIKPGERIDYELRFLKPFESTDHTYMATSAINDSTTQVKWGFDGKMPYPMNLMLLFMNMDQMLGKDLGQGLLNLKSELEKAE